MKKSERIARLFLSCLIILTSIFIATSMQPKNNTRVLESNSYKQLASKTDQYIYLSDLDYLTTSGMSQNGWEGHSIQKDRNQEGGTLSLIVEGERRNYVKGVSIHARGWATYDISTLSNKYTRFTAKIGVDAARGTNGSIFYRIYVSNDASNWTTLLQTDLLTGVSEAVDVDVNIGGYKYLRIYVDPSGSNAADHGTIANAKLVTEDYVSNDEYYNKVQKVEYYDKTLSAHDADYNYENNYQLILERAMVNKLGYWNIQNLTEFTPGVTEMFDWILENERVLEEVVEVGEIADGSKFITVLSNLYNKYKEDLKSTNGYVYEKMMIGLAAAYSTDKVISPLAFSFQTPTYDYMERFAIMKRLFDQNELKITGTTAMSGTLVTNEWFKDYHVELMRMVMQDGTTNIELGWLNGYTHLRSSLSFYIIDKYESPNYGLDRYYAEANRATYDAKYHLSEYNVPYGLENGRKISKYWMVIEHGGICWNGSRFGQSLNRVNGVPATGGYQPSHELYIHYYQDANGNGTWIPRYGNWGNAGSTWGGANPYRYLLNWNNKYFTDKKISGSKGASSTGYLYLAQANLNRYEEYKKSFYYNLIANSYTSNNLKLSSYRKALEVNPMNLDSYDGIITAYKAMSVNNGGTITPHDWYELANDIIDAYTYYPVAMFDLLKVIRPYLDGSEKLHIDRLEKEALTRATTAGASNTITTDGTRTHARQLLNKAQPDPMTFSFDGENAGKIIKNPMYQFVWGYSLDGGQTYKSAGTADSVTLTPEEIASITTENDIKFNFQGIDYIFTIDIIPGALSNLLYPNDLENRVVGIDLTYEWRNSEDQPWTSYKTASPDNTGNKTLYVRRGATGRAVASSQVIYTFTEDNQPNTRKYVPVSHLSIEAVSSEAVNNAGSSAFAIDGNYNTRWHSNWNGTDTQRFITIKLDKKRFVSAVEFVPAGGGNGKIIDGTIYGSIDGEEWIELANETNLRYTNQANTNADAITNTKAFEIEQPEEVNYIKIVANRASNGNWFTARNFNIYQDLTQNPRPTAGIGYSTEEPTTKNVIARLVNPSANITITNNNGSDTYTFTENGKFTFEFEDEKGTKGTATAKVDWIDRTAPTATIEYSTISPTNQTVVATLKPNEDVIIIDNGEYSVDDDGNILDAEGNKINGYTVDDDGNIKDENGNIIANINMFTYEFLSNGEFTFEFMDKAGNKGSATASVTWIDHDPPNAILSYNINKLTNQNVEVTAEFDEDVIVTNNGGNHSYTFTNNGEFIFEFQDKAGNTNSISAKVDWIDKVIPTAKLKYERKDNKVIVYVTDFSEEIVFKEGYGVYEYTKNGNYDIIFYDKAKNMGKVTAIITGLKDDHKDSNHNNTSNNSSNSSTNSKPENNTISIDNGKKRTGNTITVDETIEDENSDELISKYDPIEEGKVDQKEEKKDKEQNEKKVDIQEKGQLKNERYIVPIVMGITILTSVIVFIIKSVKKYS